MPLGDAPVYDLIGKRSDSRDDLADNLLGDAEFA
jgi:hypothetical protein